MRGIYYLRKNIHSLEALHKELEKVKIKDLNSICEGRSFKVVKINDQGYGVDLDAFLLRATELKGPRSEKMAIVTDVFEVEATLLGDRIKPSTTPHPLWGAISSLFVALFGISTREKLLKKLEYTEEGVRPVDFQALAKRGALEEFMIHDAHPESPSYLKIDEMKQDRVYVFTNKEETELHFHYLDHVEFYTHVATAKENPTLPKLSDDYIYLKKEASGLRHLGEVQSFEELREVMDEINPQKVVIGWLGGRYFKTTEGQVSLNAFLKKALELKNNGQGEKEDVQAILERVIALDKGALSFSFLHLFRQAVSFSWLARKRLMQRLQQEVPLRGMKKYTLPQEMSLEEAKNWMETHLQYNDAEENAPDCVLLKREGTLNGYTVIRGYQNMLGEAITKVIDFSVRENGEVWTAYGIYPSVHSFLGGRSYINEAGEEVSRHGYWVGVEKAEWYSPPRDS